MSLLTRILIILVFLATILAFLTSSVLFSHKINGEDRFEKKCEDSKVLEEEYAIALAHEQQQNLDVIKSIEILVREVQLLKEQVKLKDGEIARLYKEIDSIQIEIDRYMKDLETLLQHLQTESEDIKNYANKVTELRDKLTRLNKDKNDAVMRALEYMQQSDKIQTEVEQIETKLIALARESKNLEIRIEELVKGTGKTSGPSEKAIHALVRAVDQKAGIVVIDAGQENGVKVGDKFIVHRSGVFVAEVKAVVIYRDYCNAVVSMTNTKEMLYPQKGDAVYSQ